MPEVIRHFVSFFDFFPPTIKKTEIRAQPILTIEEAWRKDFEMIGNDMKTAMSKVRDAHAKHVAANPK